MPALGEDMYCSEQICIPPSFPYLLRQYAKAAIRTQPTDLLRWSTAYFRCLSLNIPPPVKPRLEYPIPRDFYGITPGWLKALLYQLQNNRTVPFKILWDRWIGACLQHNTLIQLLCLGGFDDPQAIPWLRFIAICAGTLSDDLTHTMILICEILTEEPEGGSAMIPVETFLDLYKFLAKIDASKDQMLKNFWFRESLLSLWRERTDKEEMHEELQEEVVLESEESIISKTSVESVEKEDEGDQLDKVVSCPSLPEDESLDFLLKDIVQDEEVEGETMEEDGVTDVEAAGEEQPIPEGGEEKEKEGLELGEAEAEAGEENEEKDKEESKTEGEEITETTEEQTEEPMDISVSQDLTGRGAEEGKKEEKADEESNMEAKDDLSVNTIENEPTRDVQHIFDENDAYLKEDLERLKALQQEMEGETDEELEKFKCRLIEEMPLTDSQQEAMKHYDFEDKQVSSEKVKQTSGENIISLEESSESQEGEEDKKAYEDVFVEAIPGIGGIVPDKLIEAVEEYMKNCAKIQHGIVMPRNIRHYGCPPLEVVDY